ncbi:MAG: hypothetical protein Q7T10_04195 [Rhodoferax sp.]|uniref:hypothetical protein n=1 Tax=Rhodoferax sp. TaxID=50421 RepID=UPI002726E1B2|nr:hypothetical protein [Rhodoferax sp.]MDO8447988.1 hypothetical protein [Rhodoferax sp.]
MNVDELQKVSEGLGWIADRLANLPEHKIDAVTSAMYCQLARLVVDELAHHLAHGVEPYEALRRTAVGEMPLTESQATLIKILAAKPTV